MAAPAELLQQFEAACEQLQQGNAEQRREAEASLLALRESPTAVSSAHALLGATAQPSAQFQALLALKVGVLRDWGATPPAQAEALRTELLEYTVGRWDGLQPFVRSQLLTLVAIILKRAWLGAMRGFLSPRCARWRRREWGWWVLSCAWGMRAGVGRRRGGGGGAGLLLRAGAGSAGGGRGAASAGVPAAAGAHGRVLLRQVLGNRCVPAPRPPLLTPLTFRLAAC